jgi:Fe-S-cluster-containing hydrogenase component 2
MIALDGNRCPKNHRCPLLSVCPVEAISQMGYSLPQIDSRKCIKCGKCVKHCPMQAFYKQNQYGTIV